MLKFTVIGDDVITGTAKTLPLRTIGIEFQSEFFTIKTKNGSETCHVQIWHILSKPENKNLQVRYMKGSSAVIVAIDATHDPELHRLDQLLTLVEEAQQGDVTRMLTYVVILTPSDQKLDLMKLNAKLMEKHPQLIIKTYCSSIFHHRTPDYIFQKAAEESIRMGTSIVPVYIQDITKTNDARKVHHHAKGENEKESREVLLSFL